MHNSGGVGQKRGKSALLWPSHSSCRRASATGAMTMPLFTYNVYASTHIETPLVDMANLAEFIEVSVHGPSGQCLWSTWSVFI